MPVVTYNEIKELSFNLAPSQLSILDVPNKNEKYVKELLDRKLKPTDNGTEIGSINYIYKSTHHFIRAKALQPENYLINIDPETAIPIRPQVFVDYNLQEGDLLISKDSNIGEAIILDKNYSTYTISGALYKLPISNNKLYLFAFLKHKYFKNQLDLLVPKGSTIRHAKTLFLNCKIPFPTQKDDANIIKYVEALVQVIINKEKEIRRKHLLIFSLIENELIENQNSDQFRYAYPTLSDLKNNNRVNAGVYSEYFCENEYKIRNYKHGFNSIKELGFKVNRGQNLQVSCIGTSIYSNEPKDNFYTVIKPMHISIYGTTISHEYLGNSKNLKTLKSGDIIFGAEGFQKGRSVVILEDRNRTITNIHGITINHKKGNIELSIFIKCFLDYLRTKGLIDLYAVGGNGGSLAMKYWDVIPFPNFPEPKQKEIISLYHKNVSYPQNLNLDSFVDKDNLWNSASGIVELDKSLNMFKKYLNDILDKIVLNEKVNINLTFSV